MSSGVGAGSRAGGRAGSSGRVRGPQPGAGSTRRRSPVRVRVAQGDRADRCSTTRRPVRARVAEMVKIRCRSSLRQSHRSSRGGRSWALGARVQARLSGQLLPELRPRPRRPPTPGHDEGPPPTSPQVTGPSTRGGWGIRTPEGLHPTRFPNALEGLRAGAGGGVWAGQRATRTGADWRGRFGLRANCYQNCYRLWFECAAGVDPLTDDALGPPYRSFDDGKRHAVVGSDPTFTRRSRCRCCGRWPMRLPASSSTTRTGRR